MSTRPSKKTPARSSAAGRDALKERDSRTAIVRVTPAGGLPGTHVLISIAEYERLTRADSLETREANEIAGELENPATIWIPWRTAKLRLAADRITKARQAAGLTQAQLAERVRVPQSQISRLERNPDRTTVRTLRRVAAALGVPVAALLAAD